MPVTFFAQIPQVLFASLVPIHLLLSYQTSVSLPVSHVNAIFVFVTPEYHGLNTSRRMQAANSFRCFDMTKTSNPSSNPKVLLTIRPDCIAGSFEVLQYPSPSVHSLPDSKALICGSLPLSIAASRRLVNSRLSLSISDSSSTSLPSSGTSN